MEKLIDLHTHTCYSDGELTPNELINLAIKNNVGTLAITDHDNIRGLKNINYEEINQDSIKLIPGIELSAKVKKGQMHILGYNIDIENDYLNQKLDSLRENNINYILLLIEQLKKDYSLNFLTQDIDNLINSNHNLGRPDIAKLLIKYGYVTTVEEAFANYLLAAYDKIREIKKGLTYEECLDLIIKGGGLPVLAHPKTLKLSNKELLILIKEMINKGLQGIEVYHSSHSLEERNNYLEIAQKYNLLVSGGSDYHGPLIKPNINIGTGKNNLKIKRLSLLDKI